MGCRDKALQKLKRFFTKLHYNFLVSFNELDWSVTQLKVTYDNIEHLPALSCQSEELVGGRPAHIS